MKVTDILTILEFVFYVIFGRFGKVAGFVEVILFPEYLLVTGQYLLGNLLSIAILLPNIGVTIRRMHDVGKSGWYSLITIYNLVLTFTKGDANLNQYEPNPEDTTNR